MRALIVAPRESTTSMILPPSGAHMTAADRATRFGALRAVQDDAEDRLRASHPPHPRSRLGRSRVGDLRSGLRICIVEED